MATIEAWGSDAHSRVSDKPDGTDFVALAAPGSMHMAAIRSDGSPALWGRDEFDQVSDAPGGVFAAVACGRDHTVGLTTSGHVLAWGRDEAGQLGTPPDGGGHIAIAAGDSWSAALDADGRLTTFGMGNPWSWGGNIPGPYWREWRLRADRFGDDGLAGAYTSNGVISREYPTPTGAGFVALVVEGYPGWGGMAMRADGSLVPFGYLRESVGTVPAGPFAEVAMGPGYCLGRRPDGRLVAWGSDPSASGAAAGILAGVPSGAGYLAVAAGLYAAFALAPDGSVVSMGSNAGGERAGLPAGTGFTRLAAGSGTVYAL